MSDILNFLINLALFMQVILLPFPFYLVLFGENTTDRLVGVDTITTLLVGIVVVLALVENLDTTIDMGIGLAALSFAGTLSIARYISEGRVF
jgi:multisubunit Na+/H+ antiporter MnhF subunit